MRRPDLLLMRIPDFALKCAGYIAEVTRGEDYEDYDPIGTGFTVALEVDSAGPVTVSMLVTAKHVVSSTHGDLAFVFNSKKGEKIAIPLDARNWLYHPTDATCDVAVQFVNRTTEWDIIGIDRASILDAARMQQLQIGIGDDVVFPSLFTMATGDEQSILPLVRQGSIAMLPKKQIQIESGFADVYLIEARSIGGISGAPVFVRQTLSLNTRLPEHDQFSGLSRRLLLLGLMHGHWDVEESHLNSPEIRHSKRGVNLGVAVVVPAYKIIEALEQDSIRTEIARLRAFYLESIRPKAD